MKYILFSLMLFISVAAGAQIQSVTLKASGLTCSMCSRAIYKALTKIDAVSEVKADIETSSYDIHFKPGAAVVLDDLKNAVKDAGFSVAAMDVKALFNNTAVQNDAHITLNNTLFHFISVAPKTLNGEVVLHLLDKDYLPEKERRKYAAQTKQACYETGTMQSAANTPERVYHVTLQQS
ncbi:heavy-metal-associated domain-containing protein [Deminuibacter soli]|uniref:Copper chaperone n=1 Tax=Deminuibacter soli TaxID=2291815 RepID=A0A3E1NHQ8_9BACT|nr:heavy-metal-associated domain-containing protein [Deminuibacter soli]RFM27486.1 copper chaperone [Deminuibacter soli]